MRQEINALWYNFVLIAERSGMMKTYMNVEPKSVEKVAKTFSYLKKLKDKILLNFHNKTNSSLTNSGC